MSTEKVTAGQWLEDLAKMQGAGIKMVLFEGKDVSIEEVIEIAESFPLDAVVVEREVVDYYCLVPGDEEETYLRTGAQGG